MNNNGKILKGVEIGNEELRLINQYTRRSLSAEELYCFSLVLCDNEIDRDFEQFPTKELYRLSELFIGKTGIFDHEPSAKNQCARIYRCRVEEDVTKTNSQGEKYACVIAEAYIPKTESMADLIAEIDAGIKKEISIGCTVKSTVCSVCGKNMHSTECLHSKGQTYQNKLCYGQLTDVTDAYEWSFVAVPSQRKAGIIKSKMFGGSLLNSILKKLQASGDLMLSEDEKVELINHMEKLKELCADGEQYRKELKSDILKLNAFKDSGMPADMLSSVIERMTIQELKAFKLAFGKKQAQPQLLANDKMTDSDMCNEYSI